MSEQDSEVYIDQKAVDKGKRLMELLGEKDDLMVAVKEGKTFHIAGHCYHTIEELIGDVEGHKRSMDHYKVGICTFKEGYFSPWFPHDISMYLSSRDNRKAMASLALQVISLQDSSR